VGKVTDIGPYVDYDPNKDPYVRDAAKMASAITYDPDMNIMQDLIRHADTTLRNLAALTAGLPGDVQPYTLMKDAKRQAPTSEELAEKWGGDPEHPSWLPAAVVAPGPGEFAAAGKVALGAGKTVLAAAPLAIARIRVSPPSVKWQFNEIGSRARDGGNVDLLINPDEAALARFAGRENPEVRFMVDVDTRDLYVWEAKTAIHDQIIDAIPKLHRENLEIWSDYPVKANELFDEFRFWEKNFPSRFGNNRPTVWDRVKDAEELIPGKSRGSREWGAASHEAIEARESNALSKLEKAIELVDKY